MLSDDRLFREKIFPVAQTISGIVALSLKRIFLYDEYFGFDRTKWLLDLGA